MNYTLAEVLVYDASNNFGLFGGGLYHFNTSSSLAEVAGLVITPTSAPPAGRWIRILPSSVDLRTINISNANPVSTAINTIINIPEVHEIVIDTISIGLDNTTTVSIPNGKRIVFKNKGKITGTGTIQGGYVECDYHEECLANASVTNLQNSTVSVKWFGAKNDGTTDNYNFFIDAINAGSEISIGNTANIYVPGSTQGVQFGSPYYLSQTLVISKSIRFFGDGYDKSVLLFPNSTLGIHITCSRGHFEDFQVRGSAGFTGPGYNSSTAHGILLNGNNNTLINIKSQAFDGDGLRISGDVNGGTNANDNQVYNFRSVYNGRHGISTQGGDSNSNIIEGFSSTLCARWGVYEESFLGNEWRSPRLASNGTEFPGSKSLVDRNGVRYWVIADNINVEPNVTPGWQNYWVVANYTLVGIQSWTPGVEYFTGGAFKIASLSAESVVYTPYVEEDQPSITMNSRSFIVGGIGAATGLIYNSLSAREGYINTSRLSIFNGANKKIILDSTLNEFGFEDYAFRWRGPEGFDVASAHLGISNIKFYTGSLQGSNLGRYSSPGYGCLALDEGVFLATDFGAHNNNSYRMLGMAPSLPTTGTYGAGDFFLYMGSDPDILGFRCVVATTQNSPSQWITIYAGNKRAFANYYDTNNQTFSSSTTPSAISLNTSNVQNGISISSNEINFAIAGSYEINYNVNLGATGSGNLSVRIQKWDSSTLSWVDVAGTKINFSSLDSIDDIHGSNTHIFNAIVGDKIRLAGTATSTSIFLSSSSGFSISTSINRL